MQVKYFKALKHTNRFRRKQKVWINREFANHLWIRFRWRGNGRLVGGAISKFDKSVGEIKEIRVDNKFGKIITD